MIDARFLQLCDSAFPSGAFSQSFGLETAVLERGVADAASVRTWIASYLEHGLATLDARWIRPAAALVAGGALRRVYVVANDRCLSLTRHDRLKRWRRARRGLAGLQ